uniref:Reverse transcriptase domain-containing protein n=1 Tax=Fagus sylvatica TaxID=28930 RepID=A0A2N9HRB2_FAGSY
MKLTFGNMTIELIVFNIGKQPAEEDSDTYEVNMIQTLVEGKFAHSMFSDPIEACLLNPNNDDVDLDTVNAFLDATPTIETNRWKPCFEELPTLSKLLPSSVQAPKLDLKPLPSDLKYAYLGQDENFHVVISAQLNEEQEKELLNVLREHKGALGWTLADIRGISPSICTHMIYLEEEAKPSREPQRRWVSPTQVVPKKTGITVVKNAIDEFILTRVPTSWRVCIDYRKLNSVTRKDHFPLSFIDQMLERLAGRQFHYFLDGYSGYNQIAIDPEDQEKTTFTCPFGTFAYKRMPFGLCNYPEQWGQQDEKKFLMEIGAIFKDNGQRLKPFFESYIPKEESIPLEDPVYEA